MYLYCFAYNFGLGLCNILDSVFIVIPEHIKSAIDGYVDHGHPVGGFVYAVLCNDLFEAAVRADEYSHLCLAGICRYIFNFTPAPCWGSKKKVVAWMKLHQDQPKLAERVASVDREKRKEYQG